MWRGRTAFAQFNKAIELAGQAQQRGEASVQQEQVQQAEKLLAEARTQFELGNAAASDDVGVLRDYATVLQTMDDIDLAAEVYERITRMQPGDAPAWLALGQTRAAMGPRHTASAIAALEQALRTGDDAARVAANNTLGTLFFTERIYEQAEPHFAAARAVDPDSPMARAGLACVHAARGEVAEASDMLDALGVPDPVLATRIDRLLSQALDDFDLGRLAFPDDAAHNAAYAKLLLRVNRVEQSVYPLDRAIALNPDDYIYRNLRASIARFLNDVQSAREAYEASLRIKPDQPYVRQALAELAAPAAPGQPGDVRP